jgi:hypothetical protein
MTNRISVSSAPIAGFGDKKYYDLIGTFGVMKKVFKEAVVDGFELQLEPEWDHENAPLTDGDLADWTKIPKYKTEEIVELAKGEDLPILSVHASRDVGNYLCSDRERDWKKGKQVIYDSLLIAENSGAEICVLHLWDTWKASFDPQKLGSMLLEVADQFPRVKASIENIPTHLEGYTPFELVKSFEYVTLDIRWAAMYKELDAFELIADSIVNVHLRGSLEENKWVLKHSDFGFYEALNKIRKQWKYSGLLTVEPEGEREGPLFKRFLEAMRTLNT